MSTEVDQASAVEPRHVQTTVMTSTSASSTSSPKISMFAAKSGFVIPKNKLSGSLVPIFRGGKKLGGSDAANEESTKQVQRKTKWGPDLTQDAAVRRGRALAYQTRVDQITQQLKSGILDTGDNQNSPLAAQVWDRESSGHKIYSEELELLGQERREAIGEILKLNPSYKAPPDYKPLLKEARVPIPVKEYPGYKFIDLIFGPGSDTQKRLEKETGAKIQVYGTKADTGEKGEITPSDGNVIQGAYEELHVHVSADTYEKIDAAVALIELLVTPVSGNPAAVSTTTTSVSGDTVNVLNQSQDTVTAVVNQRVVQPIMGPTQTPPQGQFHPYPGTWFPTGPPYTLMRPPSGFIPPPNPSAPILGNPVHLSSPPFNPSNMPSLFGARPALAAGISSVPQNPYLVPPRPQPPMQVLQRPYMPPQAHPLGHTGPPRNPHMLALQSLPAQPNISAPPPFTRNQTTPTGPPPNARPLMSSLPPMSNLHSGMLPDRPLIPVGSSTGWSAALAGTPSSLGPRNVAQMAPPMVSPQRPHPVVPQPIVASMAPPSNISAANMVSPVTFPSRPSTPQLSSTHVNRPIASPVFASFPPPQVGPSPASSASLLPTPAPTPIQSSSLVVPMQLLTARAPLRNPSPNPILGSTPVPSPVPTTLPPTSLQSGIPSSISGSMPRFTPIKTQSVTAPKPQHPSSGDFTFQPHRPQNPASQTVPRSSSQPATQNTLPPKATLQPPPPPQAPSFRLALHNSAPQPVMQVFVRPQVSNQMGQSQAQISAVPVSGNLTAISAPARLPAFSNPSPGAPTTPVSQMGPRNFNPAPQMPNLGGPFPPRPGNHLQQNYPAPAIRPESLFAPKQQFNNNPSFASGKPASSSSGGQQIYDPFSPTSVPPVPQGVNPIKVRKQENDPEYEDLMASVGVR